MRISQVVLSIMKVFDGCDKIKKMKKICGEFFEVLIRKRSNDFLLDNHNLIEKYIKVKPLHGFWAADPFVIKYNDCNYLFVEMCSYFTGNGFLACANLESKTIKWRKVLRNKNHYSFPNVFLENKNLKMVPESSQQKAILKYVCNCFPDNWVVEKILMKNVNAVDTVFQRQSNVNYLLTYEPRKQSYLKIFKENDDGYAFISSIKDTNCELRPAGQLFEYNNKIIFPSQKNKNSYGDDIIFNIIAIDEKGICFVEKIDFSISSHLPKKYNGAHTFNFNDDYEVIDARFNKFSILRIIGKLYRLIFKPRKQHPIK